VATSPGKSPVDCYSQRFSTVTSYPLTLQASPGHQDVSTFQYLALANLQPPAYSSATASVFLQSNDTSNFSIDPSSRRRKRSESALMRCNVVADGQVLKTEVDVQFGGDRDQAKIPMPAFLPLKSHQPSSAFLEEAFALNSHQVQQSNDESCRPISPTNSLTDRLESKGRKRPANLQLYFRNVEDLQAASPPPRRSNKNCSRPMSMSFSPSLSSSTSTSMNPFEEKCAISQRRRGSSFDINSYSPSQNAYLSYQAPSPGPVNQAASRLVDDGTKVATLLGINAGNRNLLVPGGLPTGEHVYDGVDIPCRSIHLQSDDEDQDDEDEDVIARGRKNPTATGVKKWLKSKRV
jgi:hypothetical protein